MRLMLLSLPSRVAPYLVNLLSIKKIDSIIREHIHNILEEFTKISSNGKKPVVQKKVIKKKLKNKAVKKK